MSKAGVLAFIERAIDDESFRAQLKADPDMVLAKFDLNEDEISAIMNGGQEELKALGLDVRLSK